MIFLTMGLLTKYIDKEICLSELFDIFLINTLIVVSFYGAINLVYELSEKYFSTYEKSHILRYLVITVLPIILAISYAFLSLKK